MTRTNELYLATALLIAGAILVVRIRLQRKPESNVPVMFFVALVAYSTLLAGPVHPWITYAGLVAALMLRFEFMNEAFTRLVHFCEYGILAVVLYQCAMALVRW